MFKFDGIYQRESFSENFTTYLLEAGISESDVRAVTDRKNLERWTFMENKDKSITQWEEYSMAPHLNYTITFKMGEAFKLIKNYPMTITWTKSSDDEFVRRIEINGKIFRQQFFFNNFGFVRISTIEGGSIISKETFTKLNPDINGFFELEKEENLLPLLRQLIPDLKADDFERMKKRGICMTWKEEISLITILEHFWGEKERMVLKLDEAVDIHHKATGIEETRLLTKISPGHFKMICKQKKDGKIVEQEMKFTEFGATVLMTIAGITATINYKRCPDIEGTWKVVTKEGESGFLDACGEPEPMKREIMASRDCHEMVRLGYGKILLKTNSKFLPAELTINMGEPWDCDLPDLGKATGIATELKTTMMICMKLGLKTITIKEKISGDFMIQECDVDGCAASKMKVVMVRQ